MFSLPTLVRWTGRVGSRSEEVDEKKVEHIVWAVRTTGHHLFPDRPCLPTALTARALLGVLGASTDLEIGVQREDGTLQAHAWLERRGDVLIGGRDARSDYQVLTDP